MENASKALIIAGAILLAILIIAMGMYIYNSAVANISSSVNNLSSSEIEAFNSSFEGYRGIQKGTQINALIGRAISNAATYADEEDRRPTVTFDHGNARVNITEAENSDIEKLSEMKNTLISSHSKYNVVLEYSERTGLIDKITIEYYSGGNG